DWSSDVCSSDLSQLTAEKREHADRHQHIVQQRDNRAYGKGEFEAERHENQNAQNAKAKRDQRTFCQLTANERAYAFRTFHIKSSLRHRLHDLLFDPIASVQRRADRDVTLAALRGLLN